MDHTLAEEAELMPKGQQYRAPAILSFLFLILGIIVIGIVLTLILRVRPGLMGILLSGLVVVLLAYWLREVRRMVRAERPRLQPKPPEWTYDLIESGERASIVAEVPGPGDQVKVVLEGMKLQIRSGGNFYREIDLNKPFELLSVSYNNGVLNVSLKSRPS